MDAIPLIRDRYRLLRPLGRGGQGTTHLAEDTASGQNVVVKRLRMADVHAWAQIELFERESRVLRSLRHDAIPRYVDSFAAEIDGEHTFVLVQQYIAAPSLQDRVASGWRATEAEICGIGARLLRIVADIHSLRPPIVHRDINPRNVLLGDDGRVYLVDFGGVQDALRLQAGAGTTVVGTPGYAPPEQILGRATVRSDLYAVAVTLLFLLTHREPADLPVQDMKLDFRSVIDASPRLAVVLDSYLDPDEAARTLVVERAVTLLEGTSPDAAGAAPAPTPFGSRLRVRDEGGLRTIVIPEGGAAGAALVLGGFSLFWLGFVAFWTFSAIAIGAPIIFPLFSIPFWGAGLFLVHRTLNSVFGRTEIALGPSEIEVVKRLFSLSRRIAIPVAEVAPLRIEAVTPSSGGAQERTCRLEAGAVRLAIGASLSDGEKDWLCRTVNAHLEARRLSRFSPGAA